MSSELFLQKRREQLRAIKDISNDQKVLTRDQLEGKYKIFAEKYPKTWINLMDKTFNVYQLERNVELYENFYRKSKGKHENKRFQADVGIGEHWARKFLYDKTGNPTSRQKNEALALARKKAGLSEEKEVITDNADKN